MADLSKLTGQALADAKWVLSFKAGTLWVTGGFRPKREAELVQAGVLIPTGNPGEFTVGKAESASGYTVCACRTCFDLSISSDVSRPELCLLCKGADCDSDGSTDCQVVYDSYGATCETVGCGNPAAHLMTYDFHGETLTDYVCADCLASYRQRPAVTIRTVRSCD